MFSSNTSAANGAANYIEDVFSTYLYTGNGSTQTITNGIDLSTKGGLVWTKRRSTADYHALFDTARTINYALYTNTTSAQTLENNSISSYNTTGYSFGSGPALNSNGNTYASWTFRKQPKFFDVVTWTGNGTFSRNISHLLASVPGAIFIKKTSAAADWRALCKNGTNYEKLYLNLTNATDGGVAISNVATSTTLDVGYLNAVFGDTNTNGATYVAYLFAHDAGGFGLTGTDNVISCGSFVGTGGVSDINLGYEPQWLLFKDASSGTADWQMYDTMRGFAVGASSSQRLNANTSGAETVANYPKPIATGFQHAIASGNTCIYIAIRRGPMKVPTSGTSVFSPISANNAQGTQNTTGFPVDLQIQTFRGGVGDHYVVDRLRKVSTNTTNSENYLVTNTTAAEASNTILTQYWNNTGFQTASGWASASTIYWNFGRAPSFFDEVCYTGTGSARTVAHNLGVAPELIITKKRSSTESWWTWCNYAPNSTNGNYANALNATWAYDNQGTSIWGSTVTRTSAAYSVGSVQEVNGSGITYVAYLFATCAGVQYINSYVGDGTTGRTINCGFTGGARFVCIKATSTTGSWWTFDSARGIVTNNDPALQLNSTAAEVTSADAIDTASSGFIVNQEATCSLNASGVTYLVWAIA